jgi:hypothetical protein
MDNYVVKPLSVDTQHHRREESLRALQGTRSPYEGAGFAYLSPKRKRNCVMRRVVS